MVNVGHAGLGEKRTVAVGYQIEDNNAALIPRDSYCLLGRLPTRLLQERVAIHKEQAAPLNYFAKLLRRCLVRPRRLGGVGCGCGIREDQARGSARTFLCLPDSIHG